jgi:ADP-ribose pyrophosphatase YjhB (NUDIX family)
MARWVRIVHGGPLPDDAPRITRVATRAVVRRGDQLLLLRSRSGDYRFPGGGIDQGETVASNVARELLEECGARLLRLEAHLLTVVDERAAREPGTVFVQESRYYLCDVHDGLEEVDHDLRERTLALVPCWVDLHAALETNRGLRGQRRLRGTPGGADTAEDPDDLAWIERETLALELVAGEEVGVDQPEADTDGSGVGQ